MWLNLQNTGQETGWWTGARTRLDQRPDLPVGGVEQRLVIGRRDRAFGVAAGDDEQVLVMVPVAPRHFAFERSGATYLHRQHRSSFRNRFEVDSHAEPYVAVRDGFGVFLSFTSDAEGRDLEADFDYLCHSMR